MLLLELFSGLFIGSFLLFLLCHRLLLFEDIDWLSTTSVISFLNNLLDLLISPLSLLLLECPSLILFLLSYFFVLFSIVVNLSWCTVQSWW